MRSKPEGIKEKPSLTDYDQVWEHSTKATESHLKAQGFTSDSL